MLGLVDPSAELCFQKLTSVRSGRPDLELLNSVEKNLYAFQSLESSPEIKVNLPICFFYVETLSAASGQHLKNWGLKLGP